MDLKHLKISCAIWVARTTCCPGGLAMRVLYGGLLCLDRSFGLGTPDNKLSGLPELRVHNILFCSKIDYFFRNFEQASSLNKRAGLILPEV